MTAPDLSNSPPLSDHTPSPLTLTSPHERLATEIAARGRTAWARAARLSDRVILLILITTALALYSPRLSTPPRFLWDEILHAYTAGEYLKGNGDAWRWDIPCAVGRRDNECEKANPAAIRGSRVGKYEWTHPPLGKEVIAAGIALLGDNPIGRRTPSVLFGAAGVGLLYLLGRAISQRRAIALLAALLLLLDGLYFVQARLATVDIFGTVFM
ncbi:MAG: glycosyltransferase family 39 protein, partial [Chloroflexota bacterium]|nr:glycosyltransferase family 39 protein [Chloroflexota bacterium]